MRVPDRFRFPGLLVLICAGGFAGALLLRWPEGTQAAGPASIPAPPQASHAWTPSVPAAVPAAPLPAAPLVESDAEEKDAAPPLPVMRPAAPPEYAYPESDVP